MSIGATAWRYAKAMPGFILGTQAELMGETLRNSKKLHGWKNMGTQISDAFETGVKAHEAAVAKNGGFFKNMLNDFTSIFPDIKNGVKSAGSIAKAKNASTLSRLWAQTKSVFKVLGKRMPLIGAALTLAFEIPNIAKATWNEGVLTGAGEAGKTAVRLGAGAVGGAIGSALIPFPFLGALVGYWVGDRIGQFIVGKSYSEKQAEAQQPQTAQANPQEFKVDTSQIPFGGGTVNDEEFQKLQNAYMQTTNPESMNFMSYTIPQAPPINANKKVDTLA